MRIWEPTGGASVSEMNVLDMSREEFKAKHGCSTEEYNTQRGEQTLLYGYTTTSPVVLQCELTEYHKGGIDDAITNTE